MIAGAANQIVKSRAFASKHDDKIAGEVELVIWTRACGWAAKSGTGGLAALSNSRVGPPCVRASRIQADDPEVVFLQFLKGADEIDDACDAKVLGGSGAGFDGCGAERSGAAFGEEDAIDARAIGDAKKSA
jgi:hypothetical protein